MQSFETEKTKLIEELDAIKEAIKGSDPEAPADDAVLWILSHASTRMRRLLYYCYPPGGTHFVPAYIKLSDGRKIPWPRSM